MVELTLIPPLMVRSFCWVVGGQRPITSERQWSSCTSQLFLLAPFSLISHIIPIPSLPTSCLITCKSGLSPSFALLALIEQSYSARCRISCWVGCWETENELDAPFGHGEVGSMEQDICSAIIEVCIQLWEENGRQLHRRDCGPGVEGPRRCSSTEIRRRLWGSK